MAICDSFLEKNHNDLYVQMLKHVTAVNIFLNCGLGSRVKQIPLMEVCGEIHGCLKHCGDS